MDEAGETAFEHALDFFGHLISGLLQIVWDLPRQYREDFNRNPDLSSLQILLLTIAAVPGLVVVPVLGLLGFGRRGPIGGSAAAAFQSTKGTTPGFRFKQSAGMGGKAMLHGAVTVVFAGAAVLTEIVKRHGDA
ncbi:hypothetical protein LTR35_000653 [Friedmanniomyces endolithicus]|uniref:Uncharacterized protein n=1 Tax=Friedmanniomyces endolithicus TaxID=329885 RepID=A0AAN6J5A5_9PEZI|nr:hypothetical protein LTS00_012172 [Friedmanniomyces endolithicus]KAK0292622.1 hypothetical protein LTR35_000653 [Friedmanniomyces endolithicus]KAK0305972.1 hypothetical protein LTR82_016528 [Friedmanniomyces endolithicus]KAK1007637.1 hypothetical protein LTR54_006363 [Friedmanniomyces endolithicus]